MCCISARTGCRSRAKSSIPQLGPDLRHVGLAFGSRALSHRSFDNIGLRGHLRYAVFGLQVPTILVGWLPEILEADGENAEDAANLGSSWSAVWSDLGRVPINPAA